MKSVDSGSLLPRRGEGEDEGVSSRGHSPHPNPRPRWGEGGYGISELLTLLTKHLTSYSDAPHLDAERIVLHVLKKREPAYLLAHATDKLSDQQIQEVTAMANRRKTGMPLAYILGEVDFFGRTFIVTPDVLIPRPDTETLIEKAIEYIIRHAGLRPGIHEEITIADICTGSGIIVITLALELEKLMQLKAIVLLPPTPPPPLSQSQSKTLKTMELQIQSNLLKVICLIPSTSLRVNPIRLI